ncbi:hypothetical protein M9H77_07439 [Catharanthus roseus]|uniref:Uncharacterized protein n=1 Tax=Catharanthus roseus TaxID=4058 RepID=A0ACC0BUY1_CATRO|nr:hypothetical protein M9H77_07439 [Catharanthus roseus]
MYTIDLTIIIKRTETGNERGDGFRNFPLVRSRMDLKPSGSRTVALTTVALIPLLHFPATKQKANETYLLLQNPIYYYKSESRKQEAENLNLFYYRRFLRLQCLPGFDPSNQ